MKLRRRSIIGAAMLAAALVALAGAGSAARSSTGAATAAPVPTTEPSISGAAIVGTALKGHRGTWKGSGITYKYLWLRCKASAISDSSPASCTEISGATTTSYTVISADLGFRMRFRVLATNKAGTTQATSAATSVVTTAGGHPANSSAPTITGSAMVGQTLTGAPGTWVGEQPITYSYHWLRCDAQGNACTQISGATQTSYLLVNADEGRTVRFKVVARNARGSGDAFSFQSDVVKGLAGGNGNVVPVTSLTARPDHLLISGIQFSPSPFSDPGGILTARFRIQLEGTNKFVSGALVYVVGIPYEWVKQPPELPTGSDGWATIQIQTTTKLPHTGALVMQVRARGPGNSEEAILGGISTRRLVQVTLK
jgi:hypothetical protein